MIAQSSKASSRDRGDVSAINLYDKETVQRLRPKDDDSRRNRATCQSGSGGIPIDDLEADIQYLPGPLERRLRHALQ
jgi:hypothetical protein